MLTKNISHILKVTEIRDADGAALILSLTGKVGMTVCFILLCTQHPTLSFLVSH